MIILKLRSILIDWLLRPADPGGGSTMFPERTDQGCRNGNAVSQERVCVWSCVLVCVSSRFLDFRAAHGFRIEDPETCHVFRETSDMFRDFPKIIPLGLFRGRATPENRHTHIHREGGSETTTTIGKV